jgi:translation initiation factor 2D
MEAGSRVSRKDLQDRWMTKMDAAYALVAMPGSEVLTLKRGEPKKIELEVEKRQGNRKYSTFVRGLEEVSEGPICFFVCSCFNEGLHELTSSFSYASLDVAQYGIDGAAFANDVAKRFACSASVETAPSGRAAVPKGCVECNFQGHLMEELKALLTGDEKICSHGGCRNGNYFVPKVVITETLRKGVPAKKSR